MTWRSSYVTSHIDRDTVTIMSRYVTTEVTPRLVTSRPSHVWSSSDERPSSSPSSPPIAFQKWTATCNKQPLVVSHNWKNCQYLSGKPAGNTCQDCKITSGCAGYGCQIPSDNFGQGRLIPNRCAGQGCHILSCRIHYFLGKYLYVLCFLISVTSEFWSLG